MNRKFYCAAAVVLLLAGGARLNAAGKQGQGKFSPLAYSMRPTRKLPSSSARTAFSRFAARQGKDWKVRYNPRTALPEAITGGRTRRYSGGPEQAAAAFFADNGALLKIDPAALRLALKKEMLGETHLQYQQYYQGLPVEFSYVRAHVTDSGEVAGYQARFEPEIELSVVPAVAAAQAVQAAVSDLGAQFRNVSTELVIFPDEQAGKLKLAWKIRGRAQGGLWVYYVDAQAGGVLLKYDDLRRYCESVPGSYYTMGSSSGTVYAISPLPTGDSAYTVSQNTWEKPKTLALSDQYFWVGGYTNTPAVTHVSGDYCTAARGKVYSSFKGPYFSVTNFRGASAHFDNGTGVWRKYTHSPIIQSPNPYANSSSESYDATVVPTLTGDDVLALVVPRFAYFHAGEMDEYGGVPDADEVHVLSTNVNFSGTNKAVASYIGQRTKPFYGPAVENNSYSLLLKADESGTYDGFAVSESSYMVLTNVPGTEDNNTGSVIWSTSSANTDNFYIDASLGHTSGLDEVNAFYHLNRMRRYFENFNQNASGGATKPADLDGRVPVMVHASGDPDALVYRGMKNAFFDLESENIFFGDGPQDNSGFYRSLALDGTIVRHEYTHLAVHRIYPIINFGEFGAISEALSDYFSLASFWKEGYAESPQNAAKKGLAALGNFLGTGYARSIAGTDMNMPDDWRGELYNDSLILSQALYTLRVGGVHSLGTVSGPNVFNGLPMADFLVWSALFYFPDSFLNFHEAMIDACKQLDSAPFYGGCGAAERTLIDNAFSDHGIAAPGTGTAYAYETGASSGLCADNNGPECAADVNFVDSVKAAVYPAGDVDYYSVPVGVGTFQATLKLPEAGAAEVYKAYALSLFDSDRQNLAEAVPVINTYEGVCPDTGDCTTYAPSVTLTYPVTAAGRYYMSVSGGPTQNYGNSGVNSSSLYTLTFSYSGSGGTTAQLDGGSSTDNEKITFIAYYNDFPMGVAPTSSTMTGAEQVFAYAQLRDHNNTKLDYARTDLTLAQGSFLQVVPGSVYTATDLIGRPVLNGSVRVQPGFSTRYPGVGTVTLEIFGRNHMGNVVSLGVTNKLNLSADKAAMTTYNNVLGAPGAKAIVKYEIQSAGTLSIKVYTQTGGLVKTLYDGTAAGKGAVDWDGTNSNGGKAASGIYFIKAIGPGLDKTDKVAIVR